MRTLTIEVALPDPRLHPNGGDRWNHRMIARLKKETRHESATMARVAIARSGLELPTTLPWPSARLSLIYEFASVRNFQNRDDDGLIAWAKHSRDGLADACIVANDRHFTIDVPRMRVSRDGGNRLIMLVTPTEEIQ